MGSLDSLKALLQKKKQEKQELVGDKKYLKRSDLEEARLKRLREEEQQERLAKEEKKRKLYGGSVIPDGRPSTPIDAATAADGQQAVVAAGGSQGAPGNAGAAHAAPPLPQDEVVRRLRALGQPATLFGEEELDRQTRLRKVEKTIALADEARGGQQENALVMLKRQEKLSKQQGGRAAAMAAADAASKAAGSSSRPDTPPVGSAAANAAAAAAAGEGPTPVPGSKAGDISDNDSDNVVCKTVATVEGKDDGGQDAVFAAFKQAAARLAAKRAEEGLPIEDRIAKYLRRWCQEWEEDLEARNEEVKQSGAGHQATLVFKQSMSYFEPLFERLKKRQIVEELKVGLWIMVQHMAERNYLAANDVYLKLAIGNAPWPIGVTHVGLHERSAREKISHVMNSSSQAHIMNDEATRKYFQAFKRLITNLQRIHPIDPSRCMDFDVHGEEGRGVAGGGSNRVALLEAQAKGEVPLALPPAPHLVAPDGSIKIPPKWDNVLRRQAQGLGMTNFGIESGSESDDAVGSRVLQGTPPRPPSTGGVHGRTPPKSPLNA